MVLRKILGMKIYVGGCPHELPAMELPLWGCVCKIPEWWVGVSPVQVFFNRSLRGCLCGAWGTSARSLTQGLLLGVSTRFLHRWGWFPREGFEMGLPL